MQREDLPGCCAGSIIYDLDEEYARQHAYYMVVKPKEKIKQELLSHLSAAGISDTFALVTTNSNQTVSREVLRELEFKELAQFPSTHAGVEITLWGKKIGMAAD